MPPPSIAPFPYFGGKNVVADLVWTYLGNVKHYLEPFFGSGAVLLNRPDYRQGEHIETICDADGYVANVWRALQSAPDAVAKVCDWPVNHADLSARKRRLVAARETLLESLIADDKFYDVELAGYWVWAASCWIGRGLTRMGQRPHVANSGVEVRSPYNTNLWIWFRQLSERLRYVRVVCGDWTRVCGGDWQDNMGVCGLFFDPPYSHDAGRNMKIYDRESTNVAQDVAQWAAERGDRKSYRIVLAGYSGEHDWLEERGWRVVAWKTAGGYSKIAGSANENSHRERLWISPHCERMQLDRQCEFDFEGNGRPVEVRNDLL